ncbi:tryptophan synthase beta subunit-like PLP-dependent enzyme [Obelidium mucronatum]|nr:tryptophan synthase beta subunit-like PLP-dependent enzyme [Obelidium mucronatum]
MVCAAKGYKFVAVMIETFSIERRKIMKFLGAKVVLTPKELKGTGMVQKAEELAKEHGWFQTKQFANPANPAYHRQTTGPEIVSDFSGKPLDYIVSGWGTGGTLTGVAGFVKSVRPDVQIIAAEPAKAQLLAGGKFGPHGIQGWAPDFIPAVLDRSAYDEIVAVADEKAMSASKLLAQKEGIFVGISSGATFAAALEVAARAPKNSHILVILPDTAERYLSTPLFADISIESDVIEPVVKTASNEPGKNQVATFASKGELVFKLLFKLLRSSIFAYSVQSGLLFLSKLFKVAQGKANFTTALRNAFSGIDSSHLGSLIAFTAFGWTAQASLQTSEVPEKDSPQEIPYTVRSPIHHNILSLVGRTPIVKINRLAPEGVDMFVKIESFNPLSSVKDRLALGVIEDAERRGLLKPGQTIVEATSGNTGIALAMVCAVKGYPFVATMIETFSVERRKIMKFLGAKVVLTPKELKGTGMVKKAEELALEHGWFQSKQFANPANPGYHRQTTGAEILKSFAGKKLDFIVSGWGTGGTLTGVSAAIKAARPEVKIVACEPSKAPLLAGGNFGPHGIQGWTPDFIPEVLNREAYDTLVSVVDQDAIATSKLLAQSEGIFVGISSGATFAAALEVAKTAPKGSSILVILPDTAERYLSTPLFADISGDSDVIDPLVEE